MKPLKKLALKEATRRQQRLNDELELESTNLAKFKKDSKFALSKTESELAAAQDTIKKVREDFANNMEKLAKDADEIKKQSWRTKHNP